MVEVKPINISLDQHSSGLSVRTAISPTLTEEFIIHPSVYSEIKKLGHAKSDVLLNESESSLGAVSVSNASVSNVIENSSYDLSHVKNFNTRNDLSSLIKDYKCNKIKSTKLKLSIIREKCSDIVLCKKVNGAMKTSSVNFNTPSPMESKYRRFALLRKIFQPWQWKRRKKRNRFEQTSRTLERKISMRSTKDQLVKKDVLMPVKHNVFLLNLPDVEEVPSQDGQTVQFSSGLEEKREVPLRTAYSQAGRCGMQPKAKHSLRAQAQLSETKTETMRTETVETFELVKVEQKLLRERRKENERGHLISLMKIPSSCPSGILVSDADCCAVGTGHKSSREVGEERWEVPDHPQGVLPQNWGKTELNCSVTCMMLKATANDRRQLALCHDEFRGA
ncbi:phosphatase and actin regulator 2 [Trichonephila clavipes]|nr:phosphatase and actin regulator 2 [Trichonephila clavipes]